MDGRGYEFSSIGRTYTDPRGIAQKSPHRLPIRSIHVRAGKASWHSHCPGRSYFRMIGRRICEGYSALWWI
jgi:hypothetical protein